MIDEKTHSIVCRDFLDFRYHPVCVEPVERDARLFGQKCPEHL